MGSIPIPSPGTDIGISIHLNYIYTAIILCLARASSKSMLVGMKPIQGKRKLSFTIELCTRAMMILVICMNVGMQELKNCVLTKFTNYK